MGQIWMEITLGSGSVLGGNQHAEDLEQTLLRYVALYNHQFPQSALKSRTPLQAMKDWYAKRPDLFVKRPYDHPGFDT